MQDYEVWGVDIFRLADLTNGRPLTAITYKIFKVKGIVALMKAELMKIFFQLYFKI